MSESMSASSALWTMPNMLYQKQNYDKDVRHYGTLCSLPLILSIVHLLFTVFFITTISYHKDANTIGNLYTLGELFSVSSFSAVLLGLNLNFNSFKALVALIGVGFGLIEIFLSTFAVKGSKKSFFCSFILYFLDTLFLIPTIICSSLLKTACHLQLYDILLNLLLHLVFIALYIYSFLLLKRMKRYEEKITLEKNEIHIQKGNK